MTNSFCMHAAETTLLRFLLGRLSLVVAVALLSSAAVSAREVPTGREHGTSAVREVSFDFGMAGWRLPARLLLPVAEGRVPGVVLVSPVSRDVVESVVDAGLCSALAAGLAHQGVAVMWYQKRLQRWPERMSALPRGFTASQETVSDAALATRHLLAHPDIDPARVFVLTLGTGGILAPRILRISPHVRGAIMLSASALPLEDTLLRAARLRAESRPGDSRAQEALARLTSQVALVRGRSLTLKTPSADLPLGLPARFWLDLRGYEAPRWLAEIRRPVLLLQPGHDDGVPSSDLDAWKSALGGRDDVTCAMLPGLDAGLDTGTGRPRFVLPERPSPSALRRIADWIRLVDPLR